MTEETKQKKASKSQPTIPDRIETLEKVVAEIAHYTGTQRILDKHGIARWVPGQEDLRKRRD